jgi:hypothetical protein
MVIRMRQNAQVPQGAFDTVPREIRSISSESSDDPSSEHWQVAHPETSEHRRRHLSVVIASLSCALSSFGCSVYDSSLLQQASLAAGASDVGGTSSDIGVAGSSNAGGTQVVAGSSGVEEGGSSAGEASGGLAGSTSGGRSAGGTAGSDSFGGAAGAGGTGGTGGTGGSVEVGGSAAGGDANPSISMIDDMEMPDQYIPSMDGRQGFWSLANDGTAGTQTPSIMTMSAIVGGRGTSMYALHTTSSGFTKTGAQVNVDLNRKTTRSTYDASSYDAVHFWAKVATGSLAAVHIALPDTHTDPGGALCTKAGQQCYDHWAADRTLSTAWAEYTVAYSDLNQYGWGANDVTALDAAHVYGIQFSWGIPAMDLWIDDISFVKK